ncbi:glycoside hydrolase family 26 protein [Arthrobacter globiformis]|uniref:glycoside hydrolase family 26 protein n=1 Tax=Arthrobacter globiformis TaxID=1665 RepID=UPI0027D8C674|nr:glycosyl hydrolase [Arthrobacter globiformis]
MVAVALTAGGLTARLIESPHRFPVPHDGKTYFGVQMDSQFDTVAGYASRLGSTPALYGRYVDFPWDTTEEGAISQEVQELADHHSSLMLTLEPRKDLAAVTPEALTALSRTLTAWNRKGVPVMVRFAHEMNGSWYPWSQQPAAYIEKFRQVAAAVHKAPSSAMLWSPNEGAGYPYEGGPYEASPGSADFQAVDTNHDGKLTSKDDPYAPYWPGDDAVDWVGLTVYHFGKAYPWGENTVPERGKLVAKITGTFKSAYTNDTDVPDFYKEYADGHKMPFAISETGSFYNTSRSDGATELAIKEAWWNQLFDPGLQRRFPRLKMALWFEYSKTENQPGNPVVDWRTTVTPQIRDPFTRAIPDRFIMAPVR